MDFLGGPFRVGRLFGIDIRVHFLLILFIAFRLFEARDDIGWALLYSGLLFGIILIHELGHCFGARSVGGDAEQILMWPLGGLAYAHAPMRPWPQFVTVACGPLVNVVFCLLSGAMITYYAGTLKWFHWSPFSSVNASHLGGSPSWIIYVLLFYQVNYFLLAFNLLPVYPLDGGQLLQTMLWPFLGLRRSMMLACQIGIGGALVFGAWGIQNGAPILFFIAIMGATTCWGRYQAAKHGVLFEEPEFRVTPRRRDSSFFSRLFGRKGGGTTDAPPRRAATPNPNPGAWDARLAADRALEQEVDRILAKVKEHGIGSLSYVERQTLENATRARRAREEELERQSRT
jgi:Zn-dependent protease